MKPLYEIANEYQKVIDLIENCDEITPELMDMLESVSSDINSKIKNVAAVIKNLELSEKNINLVIKRMEKRKNSVIKNYNRLKEYLKNEMERINLKKVNTPEFDIKIRYNKFSLETNMEFIPSEYFKEKIKVTLDKKQIINDLKNDVLIPGAQFVKKASVQIK